MLRVLACFPTRRSSDLGGESGGETHRPGGLDEIGDGLHVLRVMNRLWGEPREVAGTEDLVMSRPIMPGQYPQALGEFLHFDAILLSDRMSGGNQCSQWFTAQCAPVHA